MDEEEVFKGFVYPDDNFTRIPNEFFESELARIDNLAELKVILYVMRHTWGYQEYESTKRIMLDEFAHGRLRRDGSRMDDGTGLGLTAIKDGAKKAVGHGYLVSEIDDRNPWRRRKRYAPKMRDDDE